MKLPESFTKVTPFLKILSVFFFVLFPILGFYLGVQYQIFNTPKITPQPINNKYEAIEEELNYCLENKARIGQKKQETYSFNTFGIKSPLLENLSVDVVPFEYKRSIIENKIIYGKEEIDNHKWGISSWYLKNSGKYFSDLQNYGVPMSIKNFPIFDGYEFIDTPKWLSDRIEQWKTSGESYTNTNGIKMSWSEGGLSVSSSAMLEFFQPYLPTGKPTLYQIFVITNSSTCNPITGFNDPCVLKEKESTRKIAKEIADTISSKQN